jgi:chromate reductase
MTVIPFFHEKFQPKLPPPVPTSSSPMKKSEKQKEARQIINNDEKLKIIIINGSLRKKSTNAGLLRAIVEINNPHIDFEVADIADVPLFNEDLEAECTPSSVERIRNQISKAHGILFAVPENNSSPSAALKNVYDWLSRGEEKSVIRQIPAGMVSVGGDKGG